MTAHVTTKPMTYMVEADLYAPDPGATMVDGDLGLDESKSTTVLKLDSEGLKLRDAGDDPVVKVRSGLLTEDGKHIDPVKLAEAVRNAGMADAERGQYKPGSFPGLVDVYDGGHADGAQRQGKPWPPPNHSKVSDAR